MLSKTVAKTIFRSLLRWNRRPEVVASISALDSKHFRVDQLLPANSIIIGHEGVQAAIFQCFRNKTVTEDSLDIGFRAIRELNLYGAELKDKLTIRNRNLTDEVMAKAEFKIGQVVKYKKLKFRGIVTDWDVNLSTGRQKICVLFDSIDRQEMSDTSRHQLDGYIDSSHFVAVDDRAQTRIFNENWGDFFTGYN